MLGSEQIDPAKGRIRSVLSGSFERWMEQIAANFMPIKGIVFLSDAQGYVIGSACIDPAWEGPDGSVLLKENLFLMSPALLPNAVGSAIATEKPARVRHREHRASLFAGYDSLAYPIYSESSELIAVFGQLIEPPSAAQAFELLPAWSLTFQTLLHKTMLEQEVVYWKGYSRQSERSANRSSLLLEVVKKLHSKIDVDSVLNEMLDQLQRLYPNTDQNLYLSQDHRSTNARVRPLFLHHHDQEIYTRAFIEGQVVCELGAVGKEQWIAVAAPLIGKQGNYGVLHMTTKGEPFSESEIKFIVLVAEAAGIAFEHAKLYEQSNFMISELRLINEITRRLNQSLRLKDIFNFASSELLTIFAADYSCILEIDKSTDQFIVRASNLPEMLNEKFAADYGFSGVVSHAKEPIIISDYDKQHTVTSKLMDITKSRSLLAAPIIVNDEVVGVILVAHRKTNYFSYENYKLLQVLSVHIGLAMSNASLHAKVRRMVITDRLTGLFARHYLDEQINSLQKKDVCGCLIVVDIDLFKKINDTYGHQIGDKILIQVSGIVYSSIRATDIAARWGGEELAIYLPQASVEQTIRVAERIRERVGEETDPQVTVSCGIAEWSLKDDKISVESLFYKADMALYEAKRSGKNQIKISTG